MVVVGSAVAEHTDAHLLREVVTSHGRTAKAEPLPPVERAGPPVGTHAAGGGKDGADTQENDGGLQSEASTATFSLIKTISGEQVFLGSGNDLVSVAGRLGFVLPAEVVEGIKRSEPVVGSGRVHL